MPFLNVEIKARCADATHIRSYLTSHHAEFKGTDTQTDTYFNARQGRLKLREGNIENNLIYYERTNQQGPKDSHFTLVQVPDAAGLKQVLQQSMGIKVIVVKKREIYFIANTKFHIDEVPGLGSFVEIECSNKYADLSAEALRSQCEQYVKAFGIKEEDLIDRSYSDLLLEQGKV
jgi:adenylate cyclase, class 2